MPHSFTQQQGLQPRDPIMGDDTFSLRFGNPIKVIHDIQPSSKNTSSSSPIHHAPSLSTSHGTTGGDKTDAHHQEANHSTTSPLHCRVPSDSSIARDVANFAEFYHNQDGTVSEIDHE